MLTLSYDITIGNYRLGMLDKVEIHRSVELLADTATITLPGAEYNAALDIESMIKRGDEVVIRFGYKETGIIEVGGSEAIPFGMSQRCINVFPRTWVVYQNHAGNRYASHNVQR